MSQRDLGTFQMLWDCTSCGTPKLLGLTHRHCPHCGSPQDPTARYFPSESEAIAVENHHFVGADWRCEACDTPNGNAADFCMSCGSPKDKSKQVGTRKSQVEGAAGFGEDSAQLARQELKPTQRPPELENLVTTPSTGMPGWAKTLLSVVVLAIVFGLVFTFWKKEVGVEVTGHAWVRNIEVEVFGPKQESAWREQVPGGAYNQRCSQEQRSTRQVQDGETCRQERVDQGDGTFKKVEKCSPRYRSEPVYDTRCSYTIDTWQLARTVTAQGDSLSPPPHWPKVTLNREGQCMGCERQGAQRQTLTTFFKDAQEGKTFSCELPFERWSALQVGSSYQAKVGVMSGKLDCDQLLPL